jgi:hypothetical protein
MRTFENFYYAKFALVSGNYRSLPLPHSRSPRVSRNARNNGNGCRWFDRSDHKKGEAEPGLRFTRLTPKKRGTGRRAPGKRLPRKKRGVRRERTQKGTDPSFDKQTDQSHESPNGEPNAGRQNAGDCKPLHLKTRTRG